MKKTFLVPCCALFVAACSPGGGGEVSDVKPLKDEGVHEVRLGKVAYGNFNEFYSSIVFKDGVSPKAEFKDQLFYDSLGDDGIREISPRKFYSKNKTNEQALEDMIAELAEVTQVFPLGAEHTPLSAKIHNQLSVEGEDGVLGARKSVERLGDKDPKDLSKEEAQELAYAYSVLAEYKSANKLVSQVCKDKEKCVGKIRLNLMGKVVDESGKPVKGAQIQLLNQPNNPKAKSLTDKDGMAKISVVVRNPEKIRARVSKEGYSDAFMSDYVVMELDKEYDIEFTRKIFAAHGSAELNLSKGKKGILKTDGVTIEFKDDAFEIQTEGATTYTLKDGQVKDAKGKPYKGKVKLEVFDFIDQESILDEFLRVDVVSDEWTNIGNQFLTFGMPYFTLRDTQGNPLEVSAADPVLLQTNYNKLPGKTGKPDFFTDAEWKKLVAYSSASKEALPLNRDTIFEAIGKEPENPPPFPTWWVLRRDSGVWEPAPFKLLNEQGDMLAESYTVQ